MPESIPKKELTPEKQNIPPLPSGRDAVSAMVEAAVRPLAADSEIRLAAERFLREEMSTETDAQNEGDIERLTSRWNEVDAKKKNKARWPVAWALIAVFSAVVLIPSAFEAFAYAQHALSLSDPILSDPPEHVRNRVEKRLDPAQKRLVALPSQEGGAFEQSRALWLSDPDNPAFFAEFALFSIMENHALPPDYRDTVQRIDPDNSFFVYLEASMQARQSVQEIAPTENSTSGSPPGKSSWKVLDQAKLDKTMELIRYAGTRSKYDSYTAKMLAARTAAVKQEKPLDHLDLISILSKKPLISRIWLVHFIPALRAQAAILAERGEAEAFNGVEGNAEHFLRTAFEEEPSLLLNEEVSRGITTVIAKALSEEQAILGRSGSNDRWAKLHHHVSERTKSRSLVEGANSPDPRKTASIFHEESWVPGSRPIDSPSRIDELIKPGRLVEHEMASRAGGMISWLFGSIALLLTFLHRRRAGSVAFRLGRRYTDLLDQRDWAWILGAGVLLPFAFTMGINRLTPLGGRDFGLYGTGLLLPAGQFFGLWLLWLLLPAHLIQWRISRRAKSIHFPAPRWPGWIAIACAFASIPAIGWAAIQPHGSSGEGPWLDFGDLDDAWYKLRFFSFEDAPAPFIISAGLFLFPILWLSVSIGGALLGNGKNQMHRSASSAALVPVFTFTLVVILLSILGFQASERFWFKQDSLMHIEPGTPAWSRDEYEIALYIRNDLREAFGEAGFTIPPDLPR